MHRVERPTKRRGLPFYLPAALVLLAVLMLPGMTRAQWTTTGNNISNTNSGNVGVGTGTNLPASRLEVVNPAGGYDSINYFQVAGTTGDNSNYPGLQLKGGTLATEFPQFKLGNGGLAANIFGGRSSTYGNRMGLWLSSNSNTNAYASVQKFDGTTTTDLLVVRDSGNVGVGTTSPNQLLHVRKDQNTSTIALVENQTAGTGAQADLRVLNDAGKFGQFGVYSSNTDAYGAAAANDVHVYSTTNLDLMADGASGVIKFATGGNAEKVRIDPSGNVGVGTTLPLQRLQVGSNAGAATTTPDAISLGGTYSSQAGTNPKLRLWDNNSGAVYGLGVSSSQFDFMVPTGARYVWSVNGAEKMRLDESGNVTAAGSIAAKYQDVAEWVPSSQKLSAGTVVVLDTDRTNHVLASTTSYDTGVAGVVSGHPGIALGEGGDGKVLVATTGRVRVKVDATLAPIKVGDLLVTSDLEGVAMKSVPVVVGGRKMHAPGTIIGKALEPLEKGTGEILVLLSLQ